LVGERGGGKGGERRGGKWVLLLVGRWVLLLVGQWVLLLVGQWASDGGINDDRKATRPVGSPPGRGGGLTEGDTLGATEGDEAAEMRRQRGEKKST
jgi:hypothetical protein